MAVFFKWKIKKILFLPYGMITFFEDNLNKPIFQEFLILIMGPLFQTIFYILFDNKYHYFLLFINLLPIFPLDGSKIIFLILNKCISYYRSYIITFFISFMCIIMCLINSSNMIMSLTLLYLFYGLLRNIITLKDILIAFCYDRFINKYCFKKTMIINGLNIKKLYRGRYHYFYYKNQMICENKILTKMFDK